MFECKRCGENWSKAGGLCDECRDNLPEPPTPPPIRVIREDGKDMTDSIKGMALREQWKREDAAAIRAAEGIEDPSVMPPPSPLPISGVPVTVSATITERDKELLEAAIRGTINKNGDIFTESVSFINPGRYGGHESGKPEVPMVFDCKVWQCQKCGRTQTTKGADYVAGKCRDCAPSKKLGYTIQECKWGIAIHGSIPVSDLSGIVEKYDLGKDAVASMELAHLLGATFVFCKKDYQATWRMAIALNAAGLKYPEKEKL